MVNVGGRAHLAAPGSQSGYHLLAALQAGDIPTLNAALRKV